MLLVLVGGVMSANATDYYVVGGIAGGWTPRPISNNKALKMTESTTTSGLYYYDYASTSTDIQYFAIANGEGDNDNDWSTFNDTYRWGNSNYHIDGDKYGIVMSQGDYTLNFTPDGSSTYRIVFNSNNNQLSFVKHVDYVVAGCYGSDEEASFFGTAWDNNNASNVMTLQDDGTFVKTYSNIQLTSSEKKIKFKVVKKGDWDTGSTTNIEKEITPYTYDIKIQVWTNEFNGAVCSLTEVPITSYYVVGGLDGAGDWTVSSEPMYENSGVFSTTFSKPSTASAAYRFAVAPNTVISDGSVFNWTKLIRPYQASSSDKVLSFEDIDNYATTNREAEGNAWNIPSTLKDCILTFTYNSNTYQYSISQYFERTLYPAAEGFATFSFAYDVAIPQGITAKYASAVDATTGKITWNEFSGGIKAQQGALLVASTVPTENTPIRFTPVANLAAFSETNLMKPILAEQKLEQVSGSTRYILAKPGNSVGFYKVNSNGSWVNAGTAYLEVPTPQQGGAPDFIPLDGGTTGIANISNETMRDNQYYTLDGRRVAEPTKGLYIVNGKKVIIK